MNKFPQEKRRFQRIEKGIYVMCHIYEDSNSPWISAIARDLSEGGISIAAEKGFVAKDILEIKITTFLGHQQLCILGEVKSCRKEQKSAKTKVARISFLDIDAEQKAILRELIQILGKRS